MVFFKLVKFYFFDYVCLGVVGIFDEELLGILVFVFVVVFLVFRLMVIYLFFEYVFLEYFVWFCDCVIFRFLVCVNYCDELEGVLVLLVLLF